MMRTTPLVFSLLLVLIFSLATSAKEFEKRTTCSVTKRDVLGRRNNVKKCPCAVAQSSFTGEGGYTGFTGFAQNECGEVKTFGQFYAGFDKKKKYTFQIVDDCGNTIRELGDLGIVVNDDGSTGTFSQTFDTFNLNCDDKGIQYTKSAVYKKKRNCHPVTYKKRAPGDGGAGMQISTSDQDPAQATIKYP